MELIADRYSHAGKIWLLWGANVVFIFIFPYAIFKAHPNWQFQSIFLLIWLFSHSLCFLVYRLYLRDFKVVYLSGRTLHIKHGRTILDLPLSEVERIEVGSVRDFQEYAVLSLKSETAIGKSLRFYISKRSVLGKKGEHPTVTRLKELMGE